MPFDTASDQWAAGLRLLEGAPAEQRPVLERVTRQIEAELRRRLGGPFTSQELADLYDAGTGWTSDLAYASRRSSLRLGRPGGRRRRLRQVSARGDRLRGRATDVACQATSRLPARCLRRRYVGLRVNLRYRSTVWKPSRS